MNDLKKKSLMIVGCYFDEAKILPRDPVCAIAGLMGSPDVMGRLARNWQSVLDKFEVKVPFTAKQFFAPSEKITKSTKNPYTGWSTTRRKAFLEALTKTIEKPGIRPKAVALDATAFWAKTEEERRYLTGGRWFVMKPRKWLLSGKPASPYHYIFRAIVESCAGSVAGEDKVHLFMSTQTQYQGYAVQLYQAILNRNPAFPFRKYLTDSITYASPSQFQQLQAADLIAYELCEVAKRKMLDPSYEGTERERRLMKMRREESDFQFASARTIEQHCARFAKQMAETQRMAFLRKTMLNSPIAHRPEDCEIIGKVDAGGNFRSLDPNT
jgi:hypothetical protein